MYPQAPILAAAHELGFDQAGVCSAVPSPHFEAYEKWIDKGFAGTMDYMARQAELRRNPTALLPGVQSVIAVSLNYYQPLPEGEPKRARYSLGRDYHKVFRKGLKALAAEVERLVPGTQTRACVDSAPIFERDYAHLAGLGWFGKNTMLIDSKRGSWFLIGLLLTTADIEPSRPSAGGCGSCRACIDACPTGAIVFEDNRWQIDARSCISYLTIEHRGPIENASTHGWVFGCDVCQEVCPFNQPRPAQPLRAKRTQTKDFHPLRVWPSTQQLEAISDNEWDALTQGSATRRATAEMLRRNAKLSSKPPSQVS